MAGGVAMVFVGIVLFWLAGGRGFLASPLAGQTNLRMTFYGRAVDEKGRGLAGVEFKFLIEAYPADWSFQTRGRPDERSQVSVVSDANGDFHFDINGKMLRLTAASKAGYRELYELDVGTRRENGGNSVFTRAFSLISTGNPLYRSDPDRPAIFVFISNGAQTTTALPSQGGFRSEGRHWIANRAGWPDKPSLDDVDWADGPPRRNVSVPLVFKVVDTDGRPMPGVSIIMDIERYRTLREMRADHYDTKVRTKTDRKVITTREDGYAHATANGFRLKAVDGAFIKGMRGNAAPSPIRSVWHNFYTRDFVNRQGDLIFRCDDQNPILVVMMRGDEQGSNTMPSRGGYERRGKEDPWQRVEPAWPDDVRPSIKPAAPQTTTAPAAIRPGA